MNKPSLIEQIEFIKGARKLVDCDSIVELDSKNYEMLKAIQENLIAISMQEHAQQKMQTKIDFEGGREFGSDQTAGDYNRHDEAERIHKIQRDLK